MLMTNDNYFTQSSIVELITAIAYEAEITCNACARYFDSPSWCYFSDVTSALSMTASLRAVSSTQNERVELSMVNT